MKSSVKDMIIKKDLRDPPRHEIEIARMALIAVGFILLRKELPESTFLILKSWTELID